MSNGNFLGVSASSTIKNVNKNDLYDLRNVNGKNFRGNSVVDGVAATKNLSPSKSYFLTDYKFSQNYSDTRDVSVYPAVQKLILNEFQPYQMFTLADIMDQGIFQQLANLFINIAGQSIMSPIYKIGGKYAANNLMFTTMSGNLQASKKKGANSDAYLYKQGVTRDRKYFTSDPIQTVHNMFNGGRWLNTYQLPYFGGSYLKAAYSSNWAVGGAENFLGKSISQKVTSKMGINFPSNPKFNASMESTRENLQVSFYLINSDTNWLIKNFQFLNAIYAGTNWLHMKYCFIRPPNIYHVECPGRFRIYWAAMDCTVTFEGKLRKNKKASQQLMNFSKAIQPDMLWPDAWKLQISLRDLTPNNFNLYADYYLNGINEAQILSLEETLNAGNVIDQVKSYILELSSAIPSGTVDMIKNLASKAGQLVKIGQNKEKTKEERQALATAGVESQNAKAAIINGIKYDDQKKIVQQLQAKHAKMDPDSPQAKQFLRTELDPARNALAKAAKDYTQSAGNLTALEGQTVSQKLDSVGANNVYANSQNTIRNQMTGNMSDENRIAEFGKSSIEDRAAMNGQSTLAVNTAITKQLSGQNYQVKNIVHGTNTGIFSDKGQTTATIISKSGAEREVILNLNENGTVSIGDTIRDINKVAKQETFELQKTKNLQQTNTGIGTPAFMGGH